MKWFNKNKKNKKKKIKENDKPRATEVDLDARCTALGLDDWFGDEEEDDVAVVFEADVLSFNGPLGVDLFDETAEADIVL